MNKDFVMCFFVFIGIVFVIYMLSMIFKTGKEGLGTMNSGSSSSTNAGLTTNAKAFADRVTAEIVKMEDDIKINEYKNDYESIILSMDDLINNLMLQKVLNINTNSPTSDLADLVALNQAKDALSNVMTYVDKYTM